VSGNTSDLEVVERQSAIDQDRSPVLFAHGHDVMLDARWRDFCRARSLGSLMCSKDSVSV
jgi:hypothetical protein